MLHIIYPFVQIGLLGKDNKGRFAVYIPLAYIDSVGNIVELFAVLDGVGAWKMFPIAVRRVLIDKSLDIRAVFVHICHSLHAGAFGIVKRNGNKHYGIDNNGDNDANADGFSPFWVKGFCVKGVATYYSQKNDKGYYRKNKSLLFVGEDAVEE